jgi:hypothetical protein
MAATKSKSKSVSKAKTKRLRALGPTQFAALVLVAVLLLIGNVWLHRYTQRPTSVDEVLLTIKKEVNNAYTGVHIDDSGWFAEMGRGVALTPPNAEFKVSSRNMPTLYFTLGADVPAKAKTAKHYGFLNRRIPGIQAIDQLPSVVTKAMERAGYRTIVMPQERIYLNEDRDITCAYKEENGAGTFSCYNGYSIGAATAFAEPFALSYAEATGAKLSELTVGPLVIKSQYGAGVIGSTHEAGHDIAEAVIEQSGKKSVVLFYNKDAGPWIYITKADDEFGFPCKDYKANAEVRKVMYDQICLGDEGQVRLDTNNRAVQ